MAVKNTAEKPQLMGVRFYKRQRAGARKLANRFTRETKKTVSAAQVIRDALDLYLNSHGI